MKIALVGYGVEGKASYNYFSRFPENEIVVFDESAARPADLPKEVLFMAGKHAVEELEQGHFDKVVRTASFSPYKLKAVENVTSGTREFFYHCPAPIIGVTGTKGKGTISSLIYEILVAAGKTVWLVGNIGKAALDELPNIKTDDIVVYELSSFQLWDMDCSPHIAVISIVEPEHLDIHRDVDDYYAAKANIRRYQTIDDSCYYHPTNKISRQLADTGGPHDAVERELWRSRSSRYAIPDDGVVYVKENTFFIRSRPLCSVSALQLIGQHNIENACAAISVALDFTDDVKAIEQGLKNFKGLPHRLEFVKEVRGVKYYDDSIATTPGSAIAALRSFDAPKILILGGSDKGASYKELAQEIARQTIRKIITMGSMSEVIANELKDIGFNNISMVQGAMKEVITEAYKCALPGDIVILSPGCASFDQYKNYVDRGKQFVTQVTLL